MTDDKTYVLLGEHPENLTSGALVAPGDQVGSGDLADGDQWLIAEGRLRDLDELRPTDEEVAATAESPGLLKGKALTDRAAELDIEGRSDMSADELRVAIAAFENEGGPAAEGA